MRNVLLFLLCILCCLPSVVRAQKVGLVLSGGGAKGMTHIGIIRALEENNIPIDYIAGTSMGAIIGSLYAMGYSPDDMEALLRSPDFKRWYSGEVESQYEYYFKQNRPTPEFASIRFAFGDSLHTKPQIIPTNLVNPIQMNLVFVQLFGQATAACRGNFNNLFVPFRCIASDVYNKQPLVMRKGDLGDAVRASMSFPFVFKPIEINGVLAYDGGIYNNFPTDIMQEDFHPDVIIGSVVAANPSKPKEGDLMSQLENMIMQKTDYTIPDSAGIVMTFKYDDVSLLDFDRLKELHDIGYNRTMSLMDSIKGRIRRRESAENIRLRRMVYRSSLPQFRFRDIYIEGANAQQQSYIKKEFHGDDHEIFTYEDLKRGYFRLLADNMISEIIPHAVYDPDSDLYELHLQVKMEKNFFVKIGGSVSTTSSNQIYLGVGYQNLNYYSKEITLDGQLGKIYNNVQLMGRIDLPTRIPTSFRLLGSISTFDYYKKDKLFSKNNLPSFNSKDERFVKLMFSLPFLANKRAEFGFGYGVLKDNYYQSSVIDFGNDRADQSTYRLLGGSIGFYGSRGGHTGGPPPVCHQGLLRTADSPGIYGPRMVCPRHVVGQRGTDAHRQEAAVVATNLVHEGSLPSAVAPFHPGLDDEIALFIEEFLGKLYGHHDAGGRIYPYAPQPDHVQRCLPGQPVHFGGHQAHLGLQRHVPPPHRAVWLPAHFSDQKERNEPGLLRQGLLGVPVHGGSVTGVQTEVRCHLRLRKSLQLTEE
mgnify:CR=1 FL=1